jgi:hypothetical protein
MSEARQKLAPNKRRVLEAWERLSGDGSNPTTREIAKEASMNVNGVSQILAECADMLGLVPCDPVEHGSTQRWRAAV